MAYTISKTIFNKEALLKVIYSINDKFAIGLTETEFNYILEVKEKTDKKFNFDIFNQNLQEQQIRETLNKQFGSLRDSIYQKAFSLIER